MKIKLNGNDFYNVTADFGETNDIHLTPHTGLDLSMIEGTKLYSPVEGVIEKVVDYGSSNIGKGIIIRTSENEKLILGHLSDTSSVSIGEHIDKGEFLALSGNTGRSTGAHLHIGLRDEGGQFVDPKPLLEESQKGFISEFKGTVNNAKEAMDNAKEFGAFLREWKEEGSFFQAMYDKSFFEVITDFTKELILDLYRFVITNGDLFFIIPAIMIMFATFFIGRNKFTKWIIPLCFAYFVSVVLVHLGCLPPLK